MFPICAPSLQRFDYSHRLPARFFGDKGRQIAALTGIKEDMSGVLIEKQFTQFDIASFSQNLEGLKHIRRNEKEMKDDAQTYAISSQMIELHRKFTQASAPLSVTVAEQVIASLSSIPGIPTGFIAEKKQKDQVEISMVPYLNDVDKSRTAAAFEKRNVQAIGQFLPTFSEWLDADIFPDRDAESTLENISQAIVDSDLESLREKLSGGLQRSGNGDFVEIREAEVLNLRSSGWV